MAMFICTQTKKVHHTHTHIVIQMRYAQLKQLGFETCKQNGMWNVCKEEEEEEEGGQEKEEGRKRI